MTKRLRSSARENWTLSISTETASLMVAGDSSAAPQIFGPTKLNRPMGACTRGRYRRKQSIWHLALTNRAHLGLCPWMSLIPSIGGHNLFGMVDHLIMTSALGQTLRRSPLTLRVGRSKHGFASTA